MQYSFKPTFFLTLFCLVLFSIMFSLGIWQLNRVNEKELLQQTVNERTQRETSSLNIKPFHAQPLNPYDQTQVMGHYLPEDQFLLDNIIHKGKAGYYVLTPFEIDQTHEVILVNRGWVSQGKNRQDLPNITIDSKKRTLTGTLAAHRSKPVILGNIDQPISEDSRLWYYMDVKYFEKNAGYRVLPLALQLESEQNLENAIPSAANLIREWPKFDAKTGMHIGYSIQWFVFALFILLAFIGLSFKKINKDQQ